MPEFPAMDECQNTDETPLKTSFMVDKTEDEIDKHIQQSGSMKTYETCKSQLDTESGSFICPRKNKPLVEGKHTTREDGTDDLSMSGSSGYATGTDAADLECHQLQMTEPGRLQRIDSNERTLTVSSSKWNQLTDQEDVHLRNKQLEDENRALKEKVEQLEKLVKPEKENDNSTVPGSEYAASDARKDDVEECKVIQTIPLIEQKGNMIDEDWSKIRINMEFLMDELDPEVLITPLFSKCVLSKTDAEELEAIAESNKRKCVKNMLFKLYSCGPYVYKTLLKCLEQKGYNQAIKQLEPDSVRYKGQFKYPGHKYIEFIDCNSPNYKKFVDDVEDSIEDLYPKYTQFVVVKQLHAGCVQITFSLVSLDSNMSESELRQILETAVKSGFIGGKKVSSEGFSFEKVEEGGESIDTAELQDIQNQIRNLRRKLKDTEEDNYNLRNQVIELVDECKKVKRLLEDVKSAEMNPLQSSGAKAELDRSQSSGTQGTMLQVQSSIRDQPKEQVVDVELLRKLNNENRELRVKVEKLTEEKEYSNFDNIKADTKTSHDEDLNIATHQDFQNVNKLKQEFAALEEDNSRLRKQISELENKTKILKTEQEKGTPYVETVAFKDEFPLHHAAVFATDITQFTSVLDEQAEIIGQLDKDRDTPLDKACLSKYCPLEKVKLIVDKGYKEAETLVEICQSAPKSLLGLICGIPNKNYLDEWDIWSLKELRKQLMNGDDIHARTHYDKTLLHFASEYCDIEAMKYLIKHDCDVSSIDAGGASPIFYSCKSDKDPVQKLNLLEVNGAIIESNPIFNKTLLHTACEFGTLDAVTHLTDIEKFDVNGMDMYGKRPLDYSCKSHKQPIEKIKFLKSRGASLKCSTGDKYTLLHAACDYNTAAVVELLIGLELGVDSPDIYGYTPLHCCCRSQIDPVEKIKTLVEHGARFHINVRRQCIAIASECSLSKTVDFLKESLPAEEETG